MAFAQREAISAFRKDPLQVVMGVIGFDLTDADMAFAVRQKADTPGGALISLINETTPGDDGLRLVSVEEDEDGVPISLIEIIASKATMSTLPAAAEFGADLTLAYDFQWTLADDGSGLTPLEETILFGEFIVMGSVNG